MDSVLRSVQLFHSVDNHPIIIKIIIITIIIITIFFMVTKKLYSILIKKTHVQCFT